MPGATVLEGPMGAPDRTFPEIRIQFGASSSRYAPIDLPIAGDVDEKIANLVLDTLPGAVNPDQFVMVLGEGLMLIPLNVSGTELRLTLGAQAVQDIREKLKKSMQTSRDRIATVSRPELGCHDLVIGYQVMGRNKAGDTGRDTVESGDIAGRGPGDGSGAGPFNGQYSPAFLDSNGQTLVARGSGTGPTEWVEYLHGPLTLRCERADDPEVAGDALDPGDVTSRAQGETGGPFQTPRTQVAPAPFSPAFLSDGTETGSEDA